jgi:hypothetical protein
MCTLSTESIDFVTFYNIFYLFETFHYLYSVTPVGILSWFDEPGISLLGFEAILELLGFLFFLLLFNRLCPSLVLLSEPRELLIVDLSDMEGHGYELKGIYFLGLVVVLEIHKQCLFIGKVPVVGYVVVHFEIVGTILEVFYFIS